MGGYRARSRSRRADHRRPTRQALRATAAGTRLRRQRVPGGWRRVAAAGASAAVCHPAAHLAANRVAVPPRSPAAWCHVGLNFPDSSFRSITSRNAVSNSSPGQLHIAIIGAGATGTELSAELHHTVRQIVAAGLDRIVPERDVRIVLVEAGPRILPALPERISTATTELLQKLGVEVRTNARVTAVSAEGVTLDGGDFIPAEIVVWAAGVKGPEVLTKLDGLEVNRINQLVVLPTLQTTRDPDVFAIGDCAACPREGFTSPVPPRAQAAHQQAMHMARQIERRLAGKPLLPFKYHDFGSLVSLGRYGTVGSLIALVERAFFVDGMFARLMYRSLHKMHERAVYSTSRMMADTIARTLSRRADRVVKLH